MRLFTKNDLEWIENHGLKRLNDVGSAKVDYCEGNIGTFRVEAKMFDVGQYDDMSAFNNGPYEVTMADTVAGIWITGCGHSLQSALDDAVELLENRKRHIEDLIGKARQFNKMEEEIPISLSQCHNSTQFILFLRKTDKIFEGCQSMDDIETVKKASNALLYGADCKCYELKKLVFKIEEDRYSAFHVKKGVCEKITVDLFWEKGEAKHVNNLIFIEEFNKKIDELKKMKESAERISNTHLAKAIDSEIYGYEREIARKQIDSLVMEGKFNEADSLRKKYDIASGEA